jgi:hypothetical protein
MKLPHHTPVVDPIIYDTPQQKKLFEFAAGSDSVCISIGFLAAGRNLC